MGKISRNQVIALVLGVLLVAGIAIALVLVNAKPVPTADATPTAVPTIATQTATPTPTQSAVAPVPVAVNTIPAPAPTQSSGYPSPVSPDLKILKLSGSDDQANSEANRTAEEFAMREKVYTAIPIYENLAGPAHKDVYGARDELVAKGLITQNMANNAFAPEWNNYQLDIRAAEYTIQTTAMSCAIGGQTSDTVFDLGKMTCYYTRHYVDKSGSSVSAQQFQQNTSGLGSIDAEQQARLIVDIKNENGEWKIDAIRNG